MVTPPGNACFTLLSKPGSPESFRTSVLVRAATCGNAVNTMTGDDVVGRWSLESDGIGTEASVSQGVKGTRPSSRLAIVASTQFVWAEREMDSQT